MRRSLTFRSALGLSALLAVIAIFTLVIVAMLTGEEPQARAADTSRLTARVVKLERRVKAHGRQIIILRHRIAKLEDIASPP